MKTNPIVEIRENAVDLSLTPLPPGLWLVLEPSQKIKSMWEDEK